MSSESSGPSSSVEDFLSSGVQFRFLNSRDSLPTPALHFALAAPDENSPGDAENFRGAVEKLTFETMKSIFQEFGAIRGLSLPVGRSSGFVVFSSSRDAARALNWLNKKKCEKLNGREITVKYAAIKDNEKKTNNHNHSANIPVNNSAPSSLPPGLSIFPEILPSGHYEKLWKFCSEASPAAPSSALGMNVRHFGAPLFYEDGLFGLPRPRDILPQTPAPGQEILKEIIQEKPWKIDNKGQEQEEKKLQPNGKPPPILFHHPFLTPQSTVCESSDGIFPFPYENREILHQSSSADFNRFSITWIQPGQGMRRQSESSNSQFHDKTLLFSLGGAFVLDLYEKSEEKQKFSLFLPINTGILLDLEQFTYSYGISQRTREQFHGMKWKRQNLALVALRCVAEAPEELQNSLQQFLIANPAFSAAGSSAALGSASSIVEESDERKLAAVPVSAALMASPGLESSHVHTLYDAIASHFSHTRHSPWPRVEDFVLSIPSGSFVADVGCGNGKYLGLNKNIRMIGMDISNKLLDICRARGYSVQQADCLEIPFPDRNFDAAISIAVLHHLSTEARRLRAIQELLRIVKPGGKILLTAWAFEQDLTSRRKFPEQDVLVAWNVPKKYVELECLKGTEWENAGQPEGKTTELQENTAPAQGVGLNSDKLQFQRYCHVYRAGELEELFAASGSPHRLVEVYYDRGNWCIIAEKTEQ